MAVYEYHTGICMDGYSIKRVLHKLSRFNGVHKNWQEWQAKLANAKIQ